ncbi:laminin subunit alpha-3 isoform X2 [Parambassis ranga]|uniref:Laminin subunit alpha-3 isoform X2 n=1 Tax=Parambassis ranga TaxID=210632 RepID=A0A6P7I9P0_9TELE|nr:laminin subunit alpha-3-like isoform X2 [Parambassis ranga]
MQWNTLLLCNAVWLFLLCSAQKHPKCWHDSHTQIHQRRNIKKFCDPSLSNQTTGAATQKCSPGFYKEWTGPHRGQCVPCSCNRLSNQCDAQTGNCVNCLFNSTGDRCERCKEGYYGNAANRTCRACPCPLTQNNFALGCLDVGSGVFECLCKRGYSGARCERCAFGYYGNPMMHGGMCKPCNCKHSGVNICDSLTGECITSGNSSSGCDSCAYTLLAELEKMDDGLLWLKQQLQNFSNINVSVSRLNNLEANISDTKVQVGRYGTAVRHLDPKVEQLEADVVVVRYDLSQLTDETYDTVSHMEKVFQSVNGTNVKAEDLLSEAGALLTAIQDLITQLTEVKPGVSLSEKDKGRMMDKAHLVLQEMRTRGCAVQKDRADTEQQEAHKLLDLVMNKTTTESSQAALDQTADSLMASDSSLREVMELLLDAEDTVDRTHGLNLRSLTALKHLQRLETQLEAEQSALPSVTEMTKHLLKDIKNISSMIQEIKAEFEHSAAQVDGAKLELLKRLNRIFQIMAMVDNVTKAEEHAEELHRLATELQQLLHNATDRTELLSILNEGAYEKIISAIETAEMAANQSTEATVWALKEVEEGGLINRAAGLKANSTHLWTESNNTQRHFEELTHTMKTVRRYVDKLKVKGESLKENMSSVSDNIQKIKRADTKVLIESAKTAASAVNSTVSNVKERLKNISLEVERLTLTNVSVNKDAVLTDIDKALKSFNKTLPVLSDKLSRLEALGGKMSPAANVTQSIRRIKDIIEETRNFVKRLSIATTFNGKAHVELHPPRNLEDIKAFTAVDLHLNRHHNDPSDTDHTRRRRQDRHRDTNAFVFYLGNKDAYGDYIGMAVRSNVLICVYKLGAFVHEVETSQITVTKMNSSDFDRVIFHRVYQDAEANITRKATTQEPVSLPPKRNLPLTMTSILSLDPGSVVFYVGGYPDDFTPPVELRYPKYRGAMKMSYINDSPVSLFNYKHATNIDAKQPAVMISQTEVSDYYEGTGYRMAFLKEPDTIKRRLFKFHTNSRETNALLFYIGKEESFFCVFVERGFLVVRGQQAGRELRVQSDERVSLFDKQFAVVIADTFIVHFGSKQLSTSHIQTNYKTYYIGGLPSELRHRHNITAAPLRGCVDHLTANAEFAEYNRTIGVSDGCPVSLLGVRAATLYSTLSSDSLFASDEDPVRVSLGFRSTNRQGILLRSSSWGSASLSDLQLSLVDGFVVFNSFNCTLKSERRYSDGAWHYLSAVGRPTGLQLSIDNVNVIQGHANHIRLNGGKFKGCIANLYTRPEHSFIPTDLSSLSQTGVSVLGQCIPHAEILPVPVLKKPWKHKPIQTPTGSQCRRWQARYGYQLYNEHSWLSYVVPQQDLNYRRRSRPAAGSVHGQRQDQDVAWTKQNHPAPAEEQ